MDKKSNEQIKKVTRNIMRHNVLIALVTGWAVAIIIILFCLFIRLCRMATRFFQGLNCMNKRQEVIPGPKPNQEPVITYWRLDGKATAPMRQTNDAVGYDLTAIKPMRILPGTISRVGTGLVVHIPTGYAGIVKTRSGQAATHNIEAAAGVIDPDFRGELQVLLRNHGPFPYEVQVGMRIAQLLVVPALTCQFREETIPYVGNLTSAETTADVAPTRTRDVYGFGSTGDF